MNRNGAPAIILICLIAILPTLFTDDKSHWSFATAAPLSKPINLYTTFRDRLGATSELAEMEYEKNMSKTLNKIYDLAGKQLIEQLKQQQQLQEQEEKRKSKALVCEYNNFAYNLLNETEPSGNLPQESVAFTNNTSFTKTLPLASTHVVLESDEKQLDKEQSARKTRKVNYYNPHKMIKSHEHRSSSSKPRGYGVKPLMSLPSSLSGDKDSEKWEHAPQLTISPMTKKQAIVNVVEENDYDEELSGIEWKRNPDNEVNFHEGNMAEAADDNEDVKWRKKADESDNQCPMPDDSWHGKMQIEDKMQEIQMSGSGVVIESEEQPNSVNIIRMCRMEDEGEVGDDGDDGDDKYQLRINPRSIDAFPEVFTKPLEETVSSMEGNLRNTNNLLTPVTPIRGGDPSAFVPPVMPPLINPGDTVQRTSKEIQPYEMSTLVTQGQNPLPQLTSKPGEPNANLTNVMEKVLDELQDLKECRGGDNLIPEGSPCDLLGSWNSEAIGLQFHISLADPAPPPNRAFLEGRKIEIEISERVPPRNHDLMDCEWFLKGTMLKQFGGPFYLTAHQADKHIVATFAGLCKVCGSIPTIFGSWTFVFPAKDCHDISMAIDNRRDVMRKNNLEAKRKHRMESGSGRGQYLSCSYS